MLYELLRGSDDGDKYVSLVIYRVPDDTVLKRKIFKKNNQHDMNIIIARGAAEP